MAFCAIPLTTVASPFCIRCYHQLVRKLPLYAPLMLVVDSLLFSTAPFVPQLVSSMGNIWIVAWFTVGASIGRIVIASVSLRGRLKIVWNQRYSFVADRIHNKDFVLVSVAEWSVVGFILAAILIGPTITAVLAAMWPMWWMITLQRRNQDATKALFNQVSRTDWIAGICGCVGCILTILANPIVWANDTTVLVAGILILLVVVYLDALASLRLTWGIESADWASDTAPPTGWVILGSTLSGLLCLPFVLAAAYLLSEHTGTSSEIALCVTAGICLQAVGQWLVSTAMVHSRSSALLAICLTQPVLTMIWGSWFGVLGDVVFLPLILGMAMVCASGIFVVTSHRTRLHQSVAVLQTDKHSLT